jgi:hypothetical protein
MSTIEQFPDTGAARAAAAKLAAYRAVESDGGPALRVPGLKTLQGVKVGGVDVPVEIVEQYPTAVEGQFETVTVKLLALEEDIDGTPMIVRSTKSNFGVWPVGTVYVSGTWVEPKAK